MHISTTDFINDNESMLRGDYERRLRVLAPFDRGSGRDSGVHLHNRTGSEDNSMSAKLVLVALVESGVYSLSLFVEPREVPATSGMVPTDGD